MPNRRVLIVEDEFLIAMELEDTLLAAGYQVCGLCRSQADALAVGERTRPDFAVVDINLRPGDGRIVARELHLRYGVAVLFATGQCSDVADLERSGALACLPKPYDACDVPDALRAIERMRRGERVSALPDHMITLRAA